MIRMIIADDHLLFRAMMEEMLKGDRELMVVASCATGEDAVMKCRELNPDIALLDIGMPGMGGLGALREIKREHPHVKVAMLTTFEDDKNASQAMAYGADGYLVKDMKPETLLMSIKCIYQDMVIFHRGVFNTLKVILSKDSEPKSDKVQIDHMVFDAIDIRIMQLIMTGNTNREIGIALNYSEGTIKNRISKLLAMTGFSDRTELSVFAINNGLV